jgi:AcrR family transcriptional regulator
MPIPAAPLPPSPPGRPKDMEKRAAILEAAMGLFPARGYDGASMEAIAQAAGVSKLTVYSHFADKEALFGAAVTECCAQMLPHRLFAPEPKLPVKAALTSIGRAFVDLMMDERAIALHRVMVSQAGHNRRLAEIFFGHGASNRRRAPPSISSACSRACATCACWSACARRRARPNAMRTSRRSWRCSCARSRRRRARRMTYDPVTSGTTARPAPLAILNLPVFAGGARRAYNCRPCASHRNPTTCP